jgi:hypothetical protein
MRKCRITYFGLISLLLIALTSCSQTDWEQELMGANTNDIFTRADLIEYTINVEYAGTLGTIVEAGSYSDAQKLVVTGRIKYEDVNYVDENMKTVEVLDLSGSRFEISWIDGSFLSETTNINQYHPS